MDSFTFRYFHIPPLICVIAAVLYILKYKRLDGIERLIIIVILGNVIADSVSIVQVEMGMNTQLNYNLLAPVERTVTLIIYGMNEYTLRKKFVQQAGILLVLIITGAGVLYYKTLVEFHMITYVTSGFLVAVLSYIQLRSVVMGTAGQSAVLFFFGLANLIYFTLMISVMSAVPLSMQIDPEFATDMYDINIAAYGLWGITLITGILWKKQRI